MSKWTRRLFPIMTVVLATSSCDCDDKLRRLISNPGERKTTVEQAGSGPKDTESSAPREREPNDAPARATPVKLSGDLRPVEATIGAVGDRDWFAVTTASGDTDKVEMTVAPADADLDLVVGVAGGRDDPAEYDLGGPGESEIIPVLGLSSSPTRVRVRAKSGGDYELSFKKRLSGGSVEAEPNDTFEAASRFEAPGEIEGFYDRPGDRDVFAVDRSQLAGDVFNLEVSPVDKVIQHVEVYTDRAADTPYVDFQVPPGRAAGLPNMGLPRDVGRIWIVVSAGQSFGRDQSYRLKLLAHAPTAQPLEAEPNDTSATAQPAALGDEFVGYFSDASDVDHFKIYVDGIPDDQPADTNADTNAEQSAHQPDAAATNDAGRPPGGPNDAGQPVAPGPPDPLDALADKSPPAHVVRVDVAPTDQNKRLGLAWTTSAGSGQRESIESDEAGAPVVLCNRVVDRGFVDVEVHPLEPTERSLKPTLDYTLSTRDVRQQEGLEVEPNDTPESADKVRPKQPRTGVIARVGDTDVYGFAVPVYRAPTPNSASPPGGVDRRSSTRPNTRSELHSIRLRLHGSDLNLAFEIYDDEGGVVAQVNRGGAGNEENLRIDLPAGLYFAHVTARRGSSCQRYQLSVEVDPTK